MILVLIESIGDKEKSRVLWDTSFSQWTSKASSTSTGNLHGWMLANRENQSWYFSSHSGSWQRRCGVNTFSLQWTMALLILASCQYYENQSALFQASSKLLLLVTRISGLSNVTLYCIFGTKYSCLGSCKI